MALETRTKEGEKAKRAFRRRARIKAKPSGFSSVGCASETSHMASVNLGVVPSVSDPFSPSVLFTLRWRPIEAFISRRAGGNPRNENASPWLRVAISPGVSREIKRGCKKKMFLQRLSYERLQCANALRRLLFATTSPPPARLCFSLVIFIRRSHNRALSSFSRRRESARCWWHSDEYTHYRGTSNARAARGDEKK